MEKKSPYPKTHHPDYLKKVSDLLRDILSNSNSPLLDIVNRKSLEKLLLNSNDNIPWYGQLMTVPQTIAYFIQMNAWLKMHHIKISL